MRADSFRLTGRDCIYVLKTIKFHGEKAPTRMIAARVLYRPSLLTTRNVGMSPAEKIMVKTIKKLKKRFPGRSRLASAYAASVVMNIDHAVPTMV